MTLLFDSIRLLPLAHLNKMGDFPVVPFTCNHILQCCASKHQHSKFFACHESTYTILAGGMCGPVPVCRCLLPVLSPHCVLGCACATSPINGGQVTKCSFY